MSVSARKKRYSCICVCMVGGGLYSITIIKSTSLYLFYYQPFFSPKPSYAKIQQSQTLGYVFSLLAWSNIGENEFPEPLLKEPLAGTVRAFSFEFIDLGKKGTAAYIN